jgi:hypothetical protein
LAAPNPGRNPQRGERIKEDKIILKGFFIIGLSIS